MSRIIGAPSPQVIADIRRRAVQEAVSFAEEWSHVDGSPGQGGVSGYERLGETPIERIFFAALVSHVQFSPREIDRLFTGVPEGMREAVGSICVPLFVDAQVPVLDWRVDFLLTLPRRYQGRHRGMVVECDGHDFHERTPAQAERDRSQDRRLQDGGFAIFRFTGSELTSFPCECAEAVFEFACGEVAGHPGPHVVPKSLAERRQDFLRDEGQS